MRGMILQVQMLLALISALLPLAPPSARVRMAEILDLAANALAASEAVSADVEDLALELVAIRAELEDMAAQGRGISGLDAVMSRVRTASADLRAAASVQS